jgi:spoIIIJ-associated protein
VVAVFFFFMIMWETYVKTLVENMGFRDYRLEVNEAENHGSLFIYENETLVKEQLPRIVESINHILQMVGRKQDAKAIFLDVNNYRHEREKLIEDLARAAAKKVVATKTEISLPSMNSYERRLVHTALAIHPDITTESVGEGKERYVIIKPIGEK